MRLISYIGRVADGRGLDLLVKAFAAVASTRRDTHLVSSQDRGWTASTGPEPPASIDMLHTVIRASMLKARIGVAGVLMQVAGTPPLVESRSR